MNDFKLGVFLSNKTEHEFENVYRGIDGLKLAIDKMDEISPRELVKYKNDLLSKIEKLEKRFEFSLDCLNSYLENDEKEGK